MNNRVRESGNIQTIKVGKQARSGRIQIFCHSSQHRLGIHTMVIRVFITGFFTFHGSDDYDAFLCQGPCHDMANQLVCDA